MAEFPASHCWPAAPLAIGIGFNTALFGVVDAVLFRSLPVTDPALVEIYTSGSGEGETYSTSSYPDGLRRAHHRVRRARRAQ